MADAPNNDKSWWTTLPGILTAIAAIITAVGGLIAILAQTGQISRPGAPIGTAGAAPAAPDKPVGTTQREGPGSSVAGGGKVAPDASAKGVVITHRDGTVTVLEHGANVGGETTFALASGQYVRHDILKSLDLGPDKDWDGRVTIVLVDGETINGKVGPYVGAVRGKNRLGPYSNVFGEIRRIEFRR